MRPKSLFHAYTLCFLFILTMVALINATTSLSVTFSNKELVGKIHIETRARSYWTILPRWRQTVALGRERPPSVHSLHPLLSPPPKVILKFHKENLGLQDPRKDLMVKHDHFGWPERKGGMIEWSGTRGQKWRGNWASTGFVLNLNCPHLPLVPLPKEKPQIPGPKSPVDEPRDL